MSVFSELQRRNVFKVAAAYAVVAWVLLQIADVLLPALQLPGWTVTLVAVLLVLGFPVALLLSWAYELTPGGVQRTEAATAANHSARGPSRTVDFVIIGVLTLALGFVVFNYVLVNDSDAPGLAAESAAVAPAAATGAVTPRRSRQCFRTRSRCCRSGTTARTRTMPTSRPGCRRRYSITWASFAASM